MKLNKKKYTLCIALGIALLSLACGNVGVVSAQDDIIIDNGDPGTSSTGTWSVSGGENPYGTTSLWSRNGATYTWHADLPQTGVYEVHMWWTEYPSRSTNAPVTIEYYSGSQVVYVNQTQNGGDWNHLETYSFDEFTGATVTITAEGSVPSYCADAVKFVYVPDANIAPVANIDSISPNPALLGATVDFVGSGTDIDGTVVNQSWRSDPDGHLSYSDSFSSSSLSEGVHTIFFMVQDDSGEWSEEVNTTLTIGEAPTEVIIDNGDPGTSSTGTWSVSGGENPYGTTSLWSRNGATYTWHADLPQTGVYEVHMWWTEYPSRSTNAPVTIEYYSGSQVVYVNQTQNGGDWNHLETYSFDEFTGATVTITAEGSVPSYCADAVKFVYVPDANIAPVANIDSISPNPALLGATVDFVGSGTDIDGTVVNQSWRSDPDGHLSYSDSFSSSSLSEGVHTIFFMVQDDDGEWSEEVNTTLTIGEAPTEVIIDNGDPGTSSTGTWSVSGGENPYGTTSLWSRNGATYTWHADLPQTGVYEVHMWWTEYPSRSTNAPVTIEYYSGSQVVYVNQTQNGGDWNHLETYSFDEFTGATVTITAEGSVSSYCADAVKFVYVPDANIAPVANIDSISPNPALLGATVDFVGSGTDSDGTVVNQSWRSDPDGHLSYSASFSSSSLSEGVHTIFFMVQDDDGEWSEEVNTTLTIYVDNVPPVANIDSISPNPALLGVTVDFVGSGTDSDGTVVNQSWRSDPDGHLSYSASFSSSSLSEGLHTIFFMVQDDDGEWSEEVNTTLTIYVDNVPPVANIDSISPNPALLGATVDFVGSGTDSDGTVVNQSWRSDPDGHLSYSASFSSSSLSEGLHTIFFMVQDDDGEWSEEVNTTLTIYVDNVPPVANIDSISPNPALLGVTVDFVGSGTDSDGTVVNQSWRSDPDGHLSYSASFSSSSLSEGVHTIFFMVQDDDGEWSEEVNTTLTIYVDNVPPVANIDSISPNPALLGVTVDFVGSGTDSDGTVVNQSWRSDPDGHLSYSASFSSSSLSEGVHTIFFMVQDDDGEWSEEVNTTLTIYVDNVPPVANIDSISPNPALLGVTVDFVGSGTDSDGTVVNQSWRSDPDGHLSYSASFSSSSLSEGVHTIFFMVQDDDGEWSEEVNTTLTIYVDNVPPVANIDSISPNPALLGVTVDFVGSGTDSDGTVVNQSWRSDPDGHLSYSASFSSSSLSEGVHTIFFMVQDDDGEWSEEVNTTLTIYVDNVPPVANIDSISPNPALLGVTVDFVGSGTDSDGTVVNQSWRSDPDGHLSYSASFSSSSLSEGVHTIFFMVQDDDGEWSEEVNTTLTIYVDNVPPVANIDSISPNPALLGVTVDFVGSGTDSDGTVVNQSWRSDPDGHLSYSASFSSSSLSEGVHTIFFMVQDDDGEWSEEVNTTLTIYVDNVPPVANIDSISPNPALLGVTVDFVGSGTDSDGTVVNQSWRSDPDGHLSYSASFSSSSLSEGVHTIFFMVQDDDGEWSEEVNTTLTIYVDNVPPVANIDSISPNPALLGVTVDFVGSGTDSDGTVVNQSWRSDPDGHLSYSASFSSSSLSEGVHTIFFMVQDDDGEWSEEVNTTLTIYVDNVPPVANIDSISPNPALLGVTVDFVGSGTDSDGTVVNQSWRSDPDGHLSYSASFSSSSLSEGVHTIFFMVQDDDGEWSEEVNTTLTIYVDNVPPVANIDSISPNPALLGVTVDFVGSGTDSDGTVVNQSWRSDPDGHLSYSASFSSSSLSEGVHTIFFMVQDDDGEWSEEVNTTLTIYVDNVPPVANIDSISPNPALLGVTVDFVGSGTDSDGTVVNQSWRSDPDGHLSYSASFSSSSLSEGVHTIFFMVQDDDGEWSEEVNTTLTIYVDNVPPVANIDSISPNPALLGVTVDFVGSGTDSDGTVVNQSWRSDPDGHLSYSASFSSSSLSEGVHTIFFMVQDDDGEWSEEVNTTLTIYVDNVPPVANIDSISPNPALLGVTVDFVGSGTDSDGTVVNQSWRSDPDGHLSYSASFSSSSLSEGVHTIFFMVQDDDGEWSEEVNTTLTIYVDNVPPVANIDSISPNPALLGVTVDFVGSGTDSDGTVVNQSWRSDPDGHLSYSASFSSSSLSEGVHTIFFMVQDDDGEWSEEVNTTLTIYVDNVPPVANIDSISPNPALLGVTVDFVGSGTDSDGTVVNQSWRSDPDGHLSYSASFSSSSLSEGVHTIFFMVQDDDGEWSEEVNTTLTIGEAPTEVIIDNGDPGTSSTGTWSVSGGENPYGTTSLWSRNGATYTWHADLPQTGVYEVHMWWTEYPSRSTNAPVTIEYYSGSQVVYVNQTQNGGDWNHLETYSFDEFTGATVTITAEGSVSSYCADAVKFVYVPDANIAPVANIDSISPHPALLGATVDFVGSGTDIDGTVVNQSWRSDLDGHLNYSASFSSSSLSEGVHTIFFMVQDDSGEWSEEVNATLNIGDPEEHIYVAFIYGPTDPKPQLIAMLQDIGAYQEGSLWIYRNEIQKKSYIIHLIEDNEGLIQALKTEGSHILLGGHSNYGLGGVFATPEEYANEVIEDLYFTDDDRIISYSSKWVHVNIRGMRVGQAYPNWWPVFKDGTSSIMPYDFGDPRGDPAYNYYLTYQVPGDPTYYKVETVRNSAIKRFPDSGRPAWYSADGTPPSPATNPEYYITNPEEWYPSIEVIGDWRQSQGVLGYFDENYQLTPAGLGDNQFKWIFRIPQSDNYKVYAWWPADENRPSNASYTINHASGSPTVLADQRINGGQWNELGEFYFDVDEHSVVLSDDANAGNVVADAVRVAHADNPPDIIQADFYARQLYNETAPFEVRFEHQSTGEITSWEWDFGDGITNPTRLSLNHIYTEPGTYTVSLTISGPAGTDTKTIPNYITVGGPSPLPQAEFSANEQTGTAPLEVTFRDRSSGDEITHWAWDFGDGSTSTEQNPTHIYTEPDNYNVSLTITTADGDVTETKTGFVRVVIYDNMIDNVDYPKPHYSWGSAYGKTILFRGEPAIPEEELKYDRMFYSSCDTGIYYIDTFHRGTMFYTKGGSEAGSIPVYLKAYLEGKSDEEIWEAIQDYDPNFDYYYFNKLPSEQSISSLGSQAVLASTTEPTRPAVDYTFAPEKEAKIKELADISLEEAFAKLKDDEFVVNDDLLHKAIFTAFKDRRQEAIDLAMDYLKLPIMETVDNKRVNRFDDFYTAKKILYVFEEESVDSLLELYENSDAIAKGNIIQVLGRMGDDQAVRDLLIGALDDETFYEGEHLETMGPPLRICDVAYNQLVLRYKIKGVLRTIGTENSIENRNYHIETLKNMV